MKKSIIVLVISIAMYVASIVGIYLQISGTNDSPIKAEILADNLSPWIFLSAISAVLFWGSVIYIIYQFLRVLWNKSENKNR